MIFVVGLPKHCHAILSFFCLFKDCFSCSFEHSHAGLFSCWSKDLFSSIYPSQRRTTETGRIRWNSGAFQKQDSIAVSGLCFQLVPDHSWLWIRCSDMIAVSGTEISMAARQRQLFSRDGHLWSGTVPDDDFVNFLRTTGYGSYLIVSCPVTKHGSGFLKWETWISQYWLLAIAKSGIFVRFSLLTKLNFRQLLNYVIK